MKGILLGLACSLSFQIHALEYELQIDNDQVRVAKVKVMPHEEIGLHRDPGQRVVVALKGGVITRLEADGQVTDVKFPTGVAVFRNPDPENELHKSVNNSNESVELIIIDIKKDG